MAETAELLTTLLTLPASDLPAEWRRVYRSEPPRIAAELLRRGIAYRLQEQAFGKMAAPVARALASGGKVAAVVAPGTRYVREWNGRTIDVQATGDGMLWDGRLYRSLSAIAREVTGVAWSGPRFFGVGIHG
ncbi:DUF2924 domain-containing protein [Sphingomonas sp. GC_Shp_3]|uniref:DUF2924 domain-containing protein n=1 Tax=Sphingomonas sp. GC_Shp_3 TaxID=2937383 RepID=UPI002269AA7D|nr:DUF2924 domain-containing protein [Sphingomonas sp. GC_Shp_3]